jgi:hypothetical protein
MLARELNLTWNFWKTKVSGLHQAKKAIKTRLQEAPGKEAQSIPSAVKNMDSSLDYTLVHTRFLRYMKLSKVPLASLFT